MSRRRPASLAGAVAVLLVLAGCGASDDPVADRVQHFHQALAKDDGGGACADLAEETRTTLERQESKPCAEAIASQQLPQGRGNGEVVVYGSMAQVRYDDETVFLSRFAEGWRVVAAGCKPTSGDQPHECALEAR